MARLLVTGGAGFVGANFVHYWLARHENGRVVVLDALTYAGNRASLAPLEEREDFRFVHGDIRDRVLVERLLREEDLDTIVHFAAETHVDRSISGPDDFLDTNVVGTHCLLQAARKTWLDENKVGKHRFHHVSTDEVYGSLEPQQPAFTETTPYAPNSPYAASKAASDHLVRAYRQTYGLNTTTSHCSNNYGPYQFPEKLVPLVICNALNGETVPVYGDGRNIRDWIHVIDHCRAIELVLERGRAGESYNIGADNPLDNLNLIERICAAIDAQFAAEPALGARFPAAPAANGRESSGLIRFVEDRPGHDRRYAVDAGKISAQLGFETAHSFTEALQATVTWYLENENWWRPIRDGGGYRTRPDPLSTESSPT